MHIPGGPGLPTGVCRRGVSLSLPAEHDEDDQPAAEEGGRRDSGLHVVGPTGQEENISVSNVWIQLIFIQIHINTISNLSMYCIFIYKNDVGSSFEIIKSHFLSLKAAYLKH